MPRAYRVFERICDQLLCIISVGISKYTPLLHAYRLARCHPMDFQLFKYADQSRSPAQEFPLYATSPTGPCWDKATMRWPMFKSPATAPGDATGDAVW